MFKLIVEQTRSEGVFEYGVETISDVSEAEPKPAPAFEDFLGKLFDNLDQVVDIDLDEEPQAPSETIQTKTNQTPPREEG